MKCDIITSFIFHSHYCLRMLESLGSERRVILVDNSFRGEMKAHAAKNPHIEWFEIMRDTNICNSEDGSSRMAWSPLNCSCSWNVAMERAETEWVINVNPDMVLWPGALENLEAYIEGRVDPDLKLICTHNNFNVWAGEAKYLLSLGGFDWKRFSPCGGEDEDMLVRIAKDGKKWARVPIPAFHQDGGHRDRADMGMNGETYPNLKVFVDKWGFAPHSPEYQAIVGPAHTTQGKPVPVKA